MTARITRRTFLKAAAGTTLALAFQSLAAATERRKEIPVLLYHDISAHGSSEYTISASGFASHMEWLYSNGYRAVSFGDLGHLEDTERTVVITFDDGYASFMEYAYPLLKGYGFKATINVIGEYVGTYIHGAENPPMLSWDEYRFLAAGGLAEIGCHTDRLHVYRSRGAVGVPLNVLREDLARFQERMVREMGHRSEIIAWPYGFYSQKTEDAARDAGFKYILTSKYGMMNLSEPTFAVPRIAIEGGATLSRFRALIGDKG